MTDPRPEPPAIPTPLAHPPAPGGPSSFAVLVAEAFGSMLLVLLGVGAALFVAAPVAGVAAPAQPFTVALAFGFALVAANYALGPISGGHFNPAVTLGLATAGRFPWRSVAPYVIVQVIGGLVATTLLVLIGLFGPEGWLTGAQDAGFASSGWGALSPGGFQVGAAIIAESLFTALFVLVVLGATHAERGTRFAGVAVGLAYVALQLVLLPIDGGGLNPARSLATALYGGTEALVQVWVFVVFPVAGAMAAGLAYRALLDGSRRP